MHKSAGAPVISGRRDTCTSPSQYTVTPQAGVTYTWTVTGGTPSAATGPAVNVNWTGGPGSVTVTTTGPGTCGAVSSFAGAAPCVSNCDFCKQFKSSFTLANPVNLGSGLQSLTPTVSSSMPGVFGVTTTVLSTSVAYSPAYCGTSGPLATYIPQALNSSIPALNPPALTVPNGNQAVWQSSSAVNLSGGATTPFQLKLPPPPTFSDPACSAKFSLCLRVSLATGNCQNCDQVQCFGPYPYGAPKGTPEEAPDTTKVVPLALPDGTTQLVPEGTIPQPAR